MLILGKKSIVIGFNTNELMLMSSDACSSSYQLLGTISTLVSRQGQTSNCCPRGQPFAGFRGFILILCHKSGE
jgi:hypothetical protein